VAGGKEISSTLNLRFEAVPVVVEGASKPAISLTIEGDASHWIVTQAL